MSNPILTIIEPLQRPNFCTIFIFRKGKIDALCQKKFEKKTKYKFAAKMFLRKEKTKIFKDSMLRLYIFPFHLSPFSHYFNISVGSTPFLMLSISNCSSLMNFIRKNDLNSHPSIAKRHILSLLLHQTLTKHVIYREKRLSGKAINVDSGLWLSLWSSGIPILYRKWQTEAVFLHVCSFSDSNDWRSHSSRQQPLSLAMISCEG